MERFLVWCRYMERMRIGDLRYEHTQTDRPAIGARIDLPHVILLVLAALTILDS